MGVEQEQHIVKCSWPNVGEIPKVALSTYLLQKIAAADEDKAALIDGVTGETLTYSQLMKMIKCVSYGWQQAGLEAGQVVCVVSPNSVLTPVAFIAATAASAVVTLANPLYTPDELRRHLSNSDSVWVLSHPACLPSVQAAVKDLTHIKGIYLLGDSSKDEIQAFTSLLQEPPEGWTFPDLPCDTVVHMPYSSGTTGLPKGVELTSYNWVAVLSTSGRKEYFDVTSADICLGILPLFHAFGLAMCFITLSEGMTMITLPRFLPDTFLKAIQTYKVTVLPLVPPLALFLAKHDVVTQFDLTSVSNVICAAAPLSADAQAALSKRMGGVRVRQGYGLTEMTLATHSSETNLPGAVGAVTAHCEAKIIDMETGDSLPAGKDGEICIRGPLVMKGYYKNEAATTKMIDATGWLHTGDIGHYDENGIFFIVDRIKELIKYKGFQVAPAEIEGLLVTHPDIADAGVVGIKDEAAGELPKAYVVPRPGKTISPNDLIDWVTERVAPHKRLRGGVEVIKTVPRSPAGKILRRLLREQANV